jgi:glycosyltransferase involved in cell wall biosynthesis
MKIGIDVRMIQDFPTGIGNYRENLIKALAELPSKHQFVLVGNSKNKMTGWAKGRSGFRFAAVRSRPNSLHQHLLLPFEISRLKLDIFWTTPWGASIFLPLLGQKYALTIYDLLYRRYPKIASLKARLYETLVSKWVAQRAVIIFTISEFVKNDIVRFLRVREEKVFNIQGAVGKAYKRFDDANVKSLALNKYGIKRPYFVYLGNFRPHKNLLRLLQAFAKLKAQNAKRKATAKNLKLIIIGSFDARGRNNDFQKLQKQLTKLTLHDDVILTGRIADDREVVAILNEAVALVHPSFHEGFGLTVLEAMSCGTPVIAANAASIPEVVGEAGILVDPHRVDEIARAMGRVFNYYQHERESYKELVQKGLEQAQKFSWEKTARQVLEVFDSL